MKSFFIAVCLLVTSVAVRADREAPPYAKATASSAGTAVFIMVPKTINGQVSGEDGTGSMFVVGENGTLEKKWSTSGWYSRDVFLTNEGDYLVRIGPWHSGHEPKKEHLALTFFKRGRLIRSYSTLDVLVDANRVRRSSSHYEWRSEERPYIGMGEFWISTIEGRFFVFDLESGQIKSPRRDSEMKKKAQL